MPTSLFRTIIFSCILSMMSCQKPLVSPSPNPSYKWVNSNMSLETVWFDQTSNLRYILNRNTTSFGVEFACGFYCNTDTDSCLFGVLIVQTYIDFAAEVVWSANSYHPVKTNATLQLTHEGDLVLTDVDGTFVWSTNTAAAGASSVVGLNLTETGNFLLFDSNNSAVWQSFDHPTDCLLPGQILRYGMNLTSTLPSNTSDAALYALSMTGNGIEASILSHPPQVYFVYSVDYTSTYDKEAGYVKFENGSLGLYVDGVEPQIINLTIPEANSSQYMKLGDDGHLRVFERGNSWKEVADVYKDQTGDCGYPMACGRYGVCSKRQCSCPSRKYFNQSSERHADLGCSLLTPLSCNSSNNHTFVDIDDATYFALNFHMIETERKDVCKEACLNNCSCKAAVFIGNQCRLLSEIFSFMEPEWAFISHPTVFVKVEKTAPISPIVDNRKTGLLLPVLGSTLGVIFLAFVAGTTVFVRRRMRKRFEEVEEEYLDHVPGMPTRFSMEDLAIATDNFDKKLGEGGFGCVFEGTLNDGTRIAVKRLDDVGHIKKSFLAEVESIGSIHHINLVRLIGFCAEKSHRLLVYEYMCNGSLDRWIYCRSHETTTLDWNQRRKIILDIAKGLTYLHEDCRQKIIHLDIKPQNILLDQHYNAKLADFGLSKLVDRDQSRVVTTMRGTPGYLAPEWLSAEITEKVDVYSFGIVILEIVCGRKIFEQWRAEGERYLLTVFKRKAMEEQWLDLVDKCCLDVESNVAQVEEMLRISAWCIQGDHDKRPSMSVVIKVLEGVMDVQTDIDYNFMVPQYLSSRTPEVSAQDTTTLLPSLLSGPRNNPVRENATLELTDEGDLVLRDANGTLAWSTNTAGRSVVGLNMTETGNLVLFDASNSTVWQSFDHPTDCLLPGQSLVDGMSLTSSASSTAKGGLFSVSMTEESFVATILSDAPLTYYAYNGIKKNKKASYAKYRNGSLDIYISGVEPQEPDRSIAISRTEYVQYMKLGSDGHLRVFEWGNTWKVVGDVLTDGGLRECDYPLACGEFGICSDGQCSCPPGSFLPIDYRIPNLGCSPQEQLICNSSDLDFLNLEDINYFTFRYDLRDTDIMSCQEACLKNCSCKAAIFRYFSNSSRGGCYFPSHIFSLMNNKQKFPDFNSSIAIKVFQSVIAPSPSDGPPNMTKRKLGPLLGSTISVFVVCVVGIIGTIVFVSRRRRRRLDGMEEKDLDHVAGMPTRFSSQDLATATDNFSKKLGEGGFGAVFEGSLHNGTRIAVKKLDGVGHIKKSFLAEVVSIGSIHHINLVRLIGFCAEKSHRLLVYEYMCNGSLDRWIYSRGQGTSLGWNQRRKIILDIAKGLAYLHEDCRQKIIHLDIKPQNILLDQHYNAKLADFGLAKLIDREQSNVVTSMRGTPGYLAPEWLSAVITEKVDVYSFGIVILETVCGRKIFERLRPEEERYLPTLFMKKAELGQWLDLVDECCQDVESNVAQVEEMMQTAAWCLQSDHEKRPSMSMVVKVLEGVVDVRNDIDYNTWISRIPGVGSPHLTPLLPSVLSGPR